MEMYMFAHQDLTLLANADGYVERTYRTDTSSAQAMIDDLRTLREA
jgi:protein SCO1/2